MEVKLVPRDYQLNAPAGAPTLQADKLTLRQTAAASTAITRSVKFAVLDDEYLLELTAIMDVYDKTAESSLTSAAQKIRLKP